jgi:hypothetical protein
MFDTVPSWMGGREELCAVPSFVWDDTRVPRDFRADAGWVVDAADELSVRAQMVLCVGLYEWVRWRFDGLHDSPKPTQIARAAWCATIDPRYMLWFELSRDEWLSPVRAPLWCAATWLRPAVADGDEQPEELADGLDFLTRLALHVVPNPQRLEAWLRAVLPRLAELFPVTEESLFDDLFGARTGERRGALIGPRALDPSTPYDPASGHNALAQLLARARTGQSPYLASPEEMLDEGFEGTPYSLPPIY